MREKTWQAKKQWFCKMDKWRVREGKERKYNSVCHYVVCWQLEEFLAKELSGPVRPSKTQEV